jgi:hypothetical protein
MKLFRLVLFLAGVALYVLIRGTGPESTRSGKPVPSPAAQSIKDGQSSEPGAPQLTPHKDILPPSNALAARPSALVGQPVPAH